ncbi:MAG TPA: prepilin-type N-terminal cleavage/methylation domain-containing protein [Candidatus Saccharimonadales bacterium]
MVSSDRKLGFTIVELLVVIVVIAILAAVSIFAYNGVQTRAENAKTLAAIDQYAKALRIYKTNTGDYPLAGGGFQYGCIAESGSCGMVGGTAGTDCAGVANSSVNTTLNTAIKTVVANIPAVSEQTLQCQNKSVKGALYVMYGNFYGPDIRNGYIIYYLKGNQQCTTPGGSKLVNPDGRIYYATDTTRCVIQFDA